MAITEFGILFKKLLKDAGIEQGEIAGKMDVEEAILSHYVTGERLPKLEETVYRHMEALFTVLISEHLVTSEDQAKELVSKVPFKIKTRKADRLREELEKVVLAKLAKQEELDRPRYYTSHTEFIGRDRNIDEVLTLLLQPRSQIRVFSIVGFPGVGKTELARQIVNLPQIKSVFFPIFHCPIEDELSMEKVLKSVREQIANTGLTNSQKSLLIIDNCELIEDTAQARHAFLEFLNEQKKLTVLAVSRRYLNLGGRIEHVHRVEPLGVPINAHEALENLRNYPSIELFRQAAEKSTEGKKEPFFLTEQNIEKVVSICQALGGLPLAILIAAGTIGREDISKVYEWIESNEFPKVTNVYSEDIWQNSLDALIEKSYKLLNEQGQKLFRRLDVFQSPCRIDAVDFVCDLGDLSLSQPEISNHLAMLANQNLISYENGWIQIAHSTISSVASRKLKGESIDNMNQLLMQYTRYYYLVVTDYMLSKYSMLAKYGIKANLEELEERNRLLRKHIRDILIADEYMEQVNRVYIEEEVKNNFNEEQYSRYIQAVEEIRQAMKARGASMMTNEEEIKLIQDGGVVAVFRKQIGLKDVVPFPELLWNAFLGRTKVSDYYYKKEILLMEFDDLRIFRT